MCAYNLNNISSINIWYYASVAIIIGIIRKMPVCEMHIATFKDMEDNKLNNICVDWGL